MKFIFVLISILLLIGCSKEEKPITFSEGKNVIVVNNDFFSFNGATIGKTRENILNSENDSIKSIIDELKIKIDYDKLWYNDLLKKPAPDEEVFICLDEDVPYKAFYKVLYSIYATYTTTIRFAIGNNNKKTFQMPYFHWQSCSPIVEGLYTASIRLRLQGISKDDPQLRILSQSHSQASRYEEEKYRKPAFTIDILRQNDSLIYYVSANKIKSRFKKNYHTFQSESDLWNYVDKIPKTKNYDDYWRKKNVQINSEPNIPLKDIVPILQKLEERGYKYYFYYTSIFL